MNKPKVNDNENLINFVTELLGEYTDSIMTVIINFDGTGNFVACDGFDPYKNKEMLPVFIALMVSAIQTGIWECNGKDEILIKKPDGEIINMAERMKEMDGNDFGTILKDYKFN